MALQFCAFVCLVTADYATRRCSKYSMMSGEMARSTAHQRAFDAALGIRRCNCCQGKENGGASNNRFHFTSSVNSTGGELAPPRIVPTVQVALGKWVEPQLYWEVGVMTRRNASLEVQHVKPVVCYHLSR